MTLHQSDHAHATTTEELIVQYLDGELVRKELETMLFERLAQSAEARTLLREYLTVRGAIRSSLEDDRFHLSAELDARTRARIENMLEQGIPEKTLPPLNGFAADAPAIRMSPAQRSLKQRVLRPTLALLALLLAVGTTWFVTRNTTPQLATNSPANIPSPQLTLNQPSSAPVAQTQTVNSAPATSTRPVEIIRHIHAPAKHETEQSASLAQNVSLTIPTQQKQAEASDPSDLMISHRYAKILSAEEKHEIVITSHDRL